MVRCGLFILSLVSLVSAAPRAALLPTLPAQCVALDGGYLRRYAAPDWSPLEPVPSPGLRTLAVGPDGRLYGARADRVLRLDGSDWRQVAQFERDVQQMVVAPDGSAALAVLTGRAAEPVLAESRVWRLDLATGAITRVAAVRDAFRPWALAVSRVGDEPRLAVSTYRATRFWPQEHRCQFLFRWQGASVEPVWLGSRLSRPYLEATHADLRGDGSSRMVGLELDPDGQPGLSVYRAIGFGYEGEWRSANLPGAQRVASVGGQVVVWAPGRAWQLVADAPGYRLVELSPAPPSLDTLTAWNGRLWGWWDGAVHAVQRTDRPAERAVRLVAMGDVLLGRDVAKQIADRGADWLWAGIAPQLADADLRFANLECPVTTAGSAVPKPFSFRAEPSSAAAVLRAGGIDMVSLANNHTYDYGRDGLRQTLANLLGWGIGAAGAGLGRSGAVRPWIVERNGLRLGLLAYTDWLPEAYQPAEHDACVATLDESTLAAEVAAAKAQVDRLVVSAHWGQEYRATASDRQKRLGRLAVDAGADLVLGHHPHVAQPLETYHGRPIVYCLGNCIFDRSGPKVSNGLVVTIRLAADAVAVERVVPVEPRECRPQTTGSPRS